MLKQIAVVSLVGLFTIVALPACGNSQEDACENSNEKCASQQGFTKSDCSKASDNYDKLSDAEKERADKLADCVNDADSCDAVIKCALAP